MPKKPPRNSFYFFMIDFKEEQRLKGVNFGNMAEVASAAGPLWKDAPPSLRARYEARAKQEKQRLRCDVKLTSHGIPVESIRQQQEEEKMAEERERKDIRNIIKLKSFDNSILTEDFYIMDVNIFCEVGGEFLIGEITLLRFNLKDGVKDYYHENVNPGYIPPGYASDMKLACQEFGLEMPFEAPEDMNYKEKILAHIIDYMTQQGQIKTLPPIFTMPNKVAAVQNFIQQLCDRAREDDSLFRIYKLDFMFFTLINSIKGPDEMGLPKESLALAHLKRDPFLYTPGLGCELHEKADMTIHCTTSRAKRLAFAIMDNCCPIVGIALEPGKHLPDDIDVDGVLNFKEQRRNRVPTVESQAYDTPGTSECSYAMSTAAASLKPKKEIKTNQPMRMPTTDYSHKMDKAPELTFDNNSFPQLRAAGIGRGRGISSRSIENSQKK